MRLLRTTAVASALALSATIGPLAAPAAAAPPDAVDDSYSTPADTTLGVDAPGVLSNDDVPADAELSVLDEPANGTVTLDPDGSFSYVPDPGFVGTDTFTYELAEPDAGEQASLLHDITTGSAHTEIGAVVAAFDEVYFVRRHFVSAFGQFAYDLWRSDGTAEGTEMFLPLNDGGASFLPDTPLCAVGDLLYFRATDPDHGVELWRTDGTTSGTGLVADVRPGTESSVPFGGCVNDGTRLYFGAATTSSALRIFSTSGTGATMVFDSQVGVADFALLGGKIIHQDGAGEPSVNGVQIADLNPFAKSFASTFVPLDDRVVFVASVPNNPDSPGFGEHPELFTTTGAVGDVVSLASFSDTVRGAVPVDGGAFYYHLQSIFGFTDGLTWTPLTGSLNHSNALGSQVGFAFDDGATGSELWRSDGTEAGTELVADLNPGSGGSSPSFLRPVRDQLYFTAESDGSTAGVWRTDLTAAGTEAIGSAAALDARLFTPLGSDRVWMLADDGTHGFEPWVLGPVAGASDVATVTIDVGDPDMVTIAITEHITADDAVATGDTVTISITETIQVSDDVSPTPAVSISISETITVDDDVGAEVAVMITITETITVDDDPGLELALRLLITEAIRVSDDVAADAETGGEPTQSDGEATLDGFPVGVMVPGTPVRVTGGGFAPGSPVRIELRSQPVPLGTTIADATGRIEVEVTIPTDTPPGEHNIVGVGVNPAGGVHEVLVPILVVERGGSLNGAGAVLDEGVRFAARARDDGARTRGALRVGFPDGRFAADELTWLLVHDGMAILRGTGSVNGVSGYSFTAVFREDRRRPGFGIAVRDPSGAMILEIPMASVTFGSLRLR